MARSRFYCSVAVIALTLVGATAAPADKVAPTSTINRDEVLPPVEAEQLELGVRHAITSRLTFIGALFDVSKPTNGVRADRSFGLVGEVRHRGVEG